MDGYTCALLSSRELFLTLKRLNKWIERMQSSICTFGKLINNIVIYRTTSELVSLQSLIVFQNQQTGDKVQTREIKSRKFDRQTGDKRETVRERIIR